MAFQTAKWFIIIASIRAVKKLHFLSSYITRDRLKATPGRNQLAAWPAASPGLSPRAGTPACWTSGTPTPPAASPRTRATCRACPARPPSCPGGQTWARCPQASCLEYLEPRGDIRRVLQLFRRMTMTWR